MWCRSSRQPTAITLPNTHWPTAAWGLSAAVPLSPGRWKKPPKSSPNCPKGRIARPLNALGHKRTLQSFLVMSALPPKADIGRQSRLLADGAVGVSLIFRHERKLRHFAGNIRADETLYGVIYCMKLFGAGDERACSKKAERRLAAAQAERAINSARNSMKLC